MLDSAAECCTERHLHCDESAGTRKSTSQLVVHTSEHSRAANIRSEANIRCGRAFVVERGFVVEVSWCGEVPLYDERSLRSSHTANKESDSGRDHAYIGAMHGSSRARVRLAFGSRSARVDSRRLASTRPPSLIIARNQSHYTVILFAIIIPFSFSRRTRREYCVTVAQPVLRASRKKSEFVLKTEPSVSIQSHCISLHLTRLTESH